MSNTRTQDLIETQVTYTLEVNGEFFLIENVPARVDLDTGEQFFAPSTVNRLQEIILDRESPIRFAQTPVYEFAA
ncbi:hypothetical protein [Chamaesiphon sp. GL140_3_metabinner_50]|uniref:hypothetical protein n=1 Tax=Chamaesiphon sp. GL140_3_metabinner_50 TaxID=2970812 RepID=UPI0025DF5C22|nr:hypothetical protein [Chamaesiphon sp. GL140_3_metabinner_50]